MKQCKIRRNSAIEILEQQIKVNNKNVYRMEN